MRAPVAVGVVGLRGIPVTVAPDMDDGVSLFQVPAGPVDETRTIGPATVDPTAAQVLFDALAGLSQETPM